MRSVTLRSSGGPSDHSKSTSHLFCARHHWLSTALGRLESKKADLMLSLPRELPFILRMCGPTPMGANSDDFGNSVTVESVLHRSCAFTSPKSRH